MVQRLDQHPVERGAVIMELLPQLLLLLGVGEVGGASTRSSPEAGGPAWDAEASAPCLGLPATMRPSHLRPRLGLGGWRGQAYPLIPPGQRDVVVRDLHSRRLGAAGEGGLLLHHHDRLR
jgi:hypothetical protein